MVNPRQDNKPIMSTANPNADPTRNGDAAVTAKAKAEAESKKKEKKKKERENKKNNNNNRVKHPGLIMDGILKCVTIPPGTSAQMTKDFRLFSKSLVAYLASKGYEHWPGIIENLKNSKTMCGI